MGDKIADMLLVEQGLTVTLGEIEPVARQLLSYYDDLKRLSEEMRKFEEQYRLSSGDFYAKWKDGQLGDETDFFEWFAYCDTYRRLVEKIHRLGKELHDLLPDLLSFPPERVPARMGAHSEVEGFPHHLHDGSEENVMPGVSNIDTEMALQLISQCLASQEEN